MSGTTTTTANPLGGGLVRTLSGNSVIDSSRVTQRVTHNTKVLYHVTDANGGRAIAKTGLMLRGNDGMFGGGIYFAKTRQAAEYKGAAW